MYVIRTLNGQVSYQTDCLAQAFSYSMDVSEVLDLVSVTNVETGDTVYVQQRTVSLFVRDGVDYDRYPSMVGARQYVG